MIRPVSPRSRGRLHVCLLNGRQITADYVPRGARGTHQGDTEGRVCA